MMRTDYFMLLSPSVNRDKSWACEHCPNWITKDNSICQSCYYAFPEKYTHIAGIQERKINILFRNQDIGLYEQIVKQANMENIFLFPNRIINHFPLSLRCPLFSRSCMDCVPPQLLAANLL